MDSRFPSLRTLRRRGSILFHSAGDHPGFTLIELLIVLGIVGVLAAVVLVAINPQKQLCDARNVKRKSYVRELQNALEQYAIRAWKNPLALPQGEENLKPLCRTGVTDPACVNLDALVPDYLVALPVDINETDERFTGYTLYQGLPSGRPVVRSVYLDSCATAASSALSSSASGFSSSLSSFSAASSSDSSSSASSSSELSSSSDSSSSELSSSSDSSSSPFSEGPLNAGLVTQQGSSAAWSDLNNVKVFDGQFAEAVSDEAYEWTNGLLLSNFGFAIPGNATVTGILVTITKRAATDEGDAYFTDGSVRLWSFNQSVGMNHADAVTHWPVWFTGTTYGGSGDLWDYFWTPSSINDPTFGVWLDATCTSGAPTGCGAASVDHVNVTVYYQY